MAKRTKRKIGHRIRSLIILTVGILLASGLVLLASLMFKSEDEAYYFVDSKYANVRSRISQQYSPQFSSTIEYPVTKNEVINSYIARAIDATRASSGTMNHHLSLDAQDSHYAEHVSYQIMYNKNEFMSMVVYLLGQKNDDQPVVQTLFWTFNAKTGKIVTLLDLLGNSPDGMARARIYLTDRVVQSAKNHAIDPPQDLIDALADQKNLLNFVVLDSKTLDFPFSQLSSGETGLSTDSVQLPIANLQLFLQNGLAKSMLDVTPIDTAHTFDEGAKPITATTAPANIKCSLTKRCIALTYDDGPGVYTQELLSILQGQKVKATFFLIGKNAARFPDTVKLENRLGHSIGNHSWSHPWLPKKSDKETASELESTNTIIRQLTGKTPRYGRPPYGAIDNKVYRAYKNAGLSAIFWSVDTRDWADRDSKIVCNRVVAGARPGSIVIMHDIHQTTVHATKCIIDSLKKQSYNFVTIDELIGDVAQPGHGYYKAD